MTPTAPSQSALVCNFRDVDEQTYSYAKVDGDAPPGLGRFAFRESKFDGKVRLAWYYRAPNRPWVPVEGWDQTYPPPLPKPPREHRRCSCHQDHHVCGACGQPFWVELHGVADGYCTYCYYHG